MGAKFSAVSDTMIDMCDSILESGHISDAELRALDTWQRELSANGITDKVLIRKLKAIARRGLADNIIFDDEG